MLLENLPSASLPILFRFIPEKYHEFSHSQAAVTATTERIAWNEMRKIIRGKKEQKKKKNISDNFKFTHKLRFVYRLVRATRIQNRTEPDGRRRRRNEMKLESQQIVVEWNEWPDIWNVAAVFLSPAFCSVIPANADFVSVNSGSTVFGKERNICKSHLNQNYSNNSIRSFCFLFFYFGVSTLVTSSSSSSLFVM